MNSQINEVSVAGVRVATWNPRRPWRGRPVRLMRLGRHLPGGPRVNNFGDLLGPVVVGDRHRIEGLGQAVRPRRLMAVGSILHFAGEDEVVWGAGVNGHALEASYAQQLDIRAVRGPLTRSFLAGKGHLVPDVYGDPGLLVADLLQVDTARSPEPGRSVLIPNLNDIPAHRTHPRLVEPTLDLAAIIEAILASELVIASSLHGIVLAEALGRPAQLLRSGHEPRFKYEDYYLGTGRTSFRIAPDVTTAEQWGGEPPPIWDPTPLLEAFPRDLWEQP